MLPEFRSPVRIIETDPNLDIITRVRLILGHYDLRVYVTDKAYIDVGRGSFAAARRVDTVLPSFEGCVGTVGQFCDIADSCNLVGGGDHQNDLPVNVTFTGSPVFMYATASHKIKELRPATHRPFSIGNAVLLSGDAKVMAGAVIGDGTLIAANALVRDVVVPFSIYGGLPAKKLKDRVPSDVAAKLQQVRWWDFDIAYLTQNLDRLQELAVDTEAKHIYRKPAPRLAVRLAGNSLSLLGYVDGERICGEIPRRVYEYVMQIHSPGPYKWVPDVWNM